MTKYALRREDTLVIVIDIQDRLAGVMKHRESVVANTLHLIELARLTGMPIVVTEQYPKGLGQTVDEIRRALPDLRPVEKLTFSCCDENSFLDEVNGHGRKTAVLTGMETHVCVLQTCLGLLDRGFVVHVVNDAVCSRTKENWRTGLEFMRDAGAVVTSTEIALFQALRVAGTEEFKAVSKRIR